MGVFKLGSKGSLVANHLDGWPEGTQSIEIEPVNAADTTGAGDTFAAGYLSALTQGKDLKTCLNIGSALSADVGTRMGVILGDDVYKGVKEKLA